MISTAAVTATMAIKSPPPTPRMLPNRAASKLRVKVLNRLIRAMPRAKLAVVTMPMAASAPIFRLRVVRVISKADRNPHRLAPTKKLKDIT